MNAKEFIKQYGWGEAKNIVFEWNNYFNQYEVIKMPTHYDSDLEIFVHADDFKNLDDSDVCINDLKQLVDAWELVELKGGLYQAKKHYLDMREAINQVYYSHSCEFKSQELKKAIELVESVK